MGKRQRRRNRQQTGRKRPGNAPRPAPRVLFPSVDQPLLEVHIEPDAPEDARAMGVAYWEFSEPGTWGRNVSAIGTTQAVLKAIKGHVHASLLTVECSQCGMPVTVTTRSEMSATGFWSVDAFPREPVKAAAPCEDCRAAQAAARAAEAERQQEQRREQDKRRAASAGKWLDAEYLVPEAGENPDRLAALALRAISEILERTGKDAIGPLNVLPYTITGTADGDLTVFKELHRKGWLAPTRPAKINDFAFDEDDNVTGVYVDRVPWCLPQWMGEREEALQQASFAAIMVLEPDDLQRILTDVEATMTVDYLEGLLTRKYEEEPIPEHRLPDAYAIAHRALEGGFTLEQMIAVAWSAAAGAVAWGQRTKGLKPGSVSAAAVTTMERRAGYAKDRPVVEYDVPNWLARPAIRATAQRLLEDYRRGEAAQTAYREFRSVLQRVIVRPSDALELDDDLAEEQHRGPSPWTEDASARLTAQDDHAEKSFAVVSPGGNLEIRTAHTLAKVRAVAGEPHGLAEHMGIDTIPMIGVVVPVFIDRDTHPVNTVAAQMLALLGASPDGANGHVTFYQTDGRNRFVDMGDDVRDLIQTAFDAVRAQATVDAD